LTGVDPLISGSFSRRALLVGTAGALVLVACGSDDGDDEDAAATTLELDEVDPNAVVLAAVFNPGPGYAAAGIPQRLTWSLRDADGAPAADPPETITLQLYYEGTPDDAGPDGEGLRQPVGEPNELTRHDADIPIPYYPLSFTPDEVGFYSAVLTLDGGDEVGAAFEVSDPAEVELVQPGEPMVPVETPTVADARDVTPICTRDPQCNFHDVTAAQVLAEGRPLALLISTPAFCQTDVCGPVLDLLIDASSDYPDIAFVHAEVYNNPDNDSGDPTIDGVTAAVTDYGLNFEPTLILGDASGVLVERLDNLYDADDVRAGLDKINPT
jgi:hypothetical protein